MLRRLGLICLLASCDHIFGLDRVTTPADAACGGADLQTDPANCGTCTNACDPGDSCVAGACHAPCLVTGPVTDPWGLVWDGIDRPAAPLDAAGIACRASNARLPTATEIYRASATQGGAVGMSFDIDYLWSLAPNDALEQATVRLGDGGTSSAAAMSAQPFRCVCDTVPPPPSFTTCEGPLGASCFALGKYNLDALDRPALRTSAASWECVHDHAHLADSPALVEAIRAGLPGSGEAVTTADGWIYSAASALTWSGDPASWELAGNLGSVDFTTPAPFRCIGPAAVVVADPTPVPNQFVAPGTSYKSETVDTPALGWADTNDACIARGGHLPRGLELAELISQGLPGSNLYLRTSDELGYGSGEFLSLVARWQGHDVRYSYENGNSATVSWDFRDPPYPFRCIYFPIDPAYVAPTSCVGGCFALSFAGRTMWFDAMDRPAATVAGAANICQGRGGHLPSLRDYQEAIRGGLPNGTGVDIATSDTGQGQIIVAAWHDVDLASNDLYPSYMSWTTPDMSLAYRCMWTNEIR